MEYEFVEPLYRVRDTSDETIANLYATWLVTRAEHHNRGFTLPKDYKKNMRMWSAFKKIATFLNGTEVEPQHFFQAQLMGWKNPYPMMFASDKGIANYEKYHKAIHKSKNFLTDLKKSLKYVVTYCEKNDITFDKYPFHMNGKTIVSTIHIQTGLLHPAIMLIHPRYDEWLRSLDSDVCEGIKDQIKKYIPEIERNFETVRKIKDMIL